MLSDPRPLPVGVEVEKYPLAVWGHREVDGSEPKTQVAKQPCHPLADVRRRFDGSVAQCGIVGTPVHLCGVGMSGDRGRNIVLVYDDQSNLVVFVNPLLEQVSGLADRRIVQLCRTDTVGVHRRTRDAWGGQWLVDQLPDVGGKADRRGRFIGDQRGWQL